VFETAHITGVYGGGIIGVICVIAGVIWGVASRSRQR
jgi:hypothetical protein